MKTYGPPSSLLRFSGGPIQIDGYDLDVTLKQKYPVEQGVNHHLWIQTVPNNTV